MQVKPNVGHSEGASGITSVIKSVLSLENKAIAPNIYFNTPNPQVQWKEWNLHVPTEVTDWPRDAFERISVNCFGIGGANAHAVIDSASSFKLPLAREPDWSCEKYKTKVLVVSARSEEALKQRIDDIVQYISMTRHNLHDLAHTLGVRREHLSNRAFAIIDTSSSEQLSTTSFKSHEACESKIVFAFTGQGAQWPAMGKNLFQNFESFRNSIRYMDDVLQSLETKPDWRLEGKISHNINTWRQSL